MTNKTKTKTKTTGATLQSAHHDIIGGKRRILTAGATDDAGRHWPVGTVYQPSSAGGSGQVVVIKGERVLFTAQARGDVK